MRKSLFEKIKERKICFLEEVLKIQDLIKSDYYFKEYISKEFQYSNYRFAFSCYEDARDYIINTHSDSFHNALSYYNAGQYDSNYNKWKIKLDDFLDYIEFYRTLCMDRVNELCNTIALRQLIDILNFDAKILGYSLLFDTKDKVYRVMLKNPAAESVALTVKEKTRDKIYSYLTIRKGKVSEKRECLKSLADDVELLCDKYDVKDFNKVKEFIQCIRHTKDDKNLQKKFPFYYKNEEKWLDNSFKMMIGTLAYKDVKDIVKEIKDLQANNGGE